MWNPIAYALGFIDTENISARCMLTIFQFFAAKTEASVLRMLEGSPHEYLHKPIINYLEARVPKSLPVVKCGKFSILERAKICKLMA
jgi:zeta-carotene desaturase